MKRQRPRRRTSSEVRQDPSLKWGVSVPRSLALQIQRRLSDPHRPQREIYGSRSRLVCALLHRWLEDPTIIGKSPEELRADALQDLKFIRRMFK